MHCRNLPNEHIRTKKQNPFLWQCLSSNLCWQWLTLYSWQWKIFKGLRFVFTEQSKRKNLELRGKSWWLAQGMENSWLEIYVSTWESNCLNLIQSIGLMIQTVMSMYQCFLVIVHCNCIEIFVLVRSSFYNWSFIM